MTTKTKQDLKQMAEAICTVQKEIKKREKLLKSLKESLSLYMSPGESVSCPMGVVQMIEGKNSLVYTSKEAEKKARAHKELMISSGEAINKKGDPFLQVNLSKECL